MSARHHLHGARLRHGFTLVELVVGIALAALLAAAVNGVTLEALASYRAARDANERVRSARLALERMADAVRATERLLLPRVDAPGTPQGESVRDQSVPPVPGQESRSAVLAVTLDPTLDRDGDGVADADNDGDGRVDEDPSHDLTRDAKSGIVGIDDDGDGSVDEHGDRDDDEDGADNEDSWNGLDDDGDGSVDEDPKHDMSDDGEPGLATVDDDRDGSVDEGDDKDDDEDGVVNEDWLDPVVFHLQGSNLVERTPVPGAADGTSFVTRTLAEGVVRLRVARLPRAAADRATLVELRLEIEGAEGETSALETRVRVGGPRT